MIWPSVYDLAVYDLAEYSEVVNDLAMSCKVIDNLTAYYEQAINDLVI